MPTLQTTSLSYTETLKTISVHSGSKKYQSHKKTVTFFSSRYSSINAKQISSI
jgi:hypothetical protein